MEHQYTLEELREMEQLTSKIAENIRFINEKKPTLERPSSFDIVPSPQAEFSTWRDERDLVSAMMNLADCECGGGAHVYAHEDFVVVSAAPMAYETVCNLVHEHLDEIDKAIADEAAEVRAKQ